MSALAPADELAAIRARIATLKRRELALRRHLMAAPAAQLTGADTRVEVRQRVLRLFDHRLLPDPIREDPLYWRERVVTELRCVPLDGREPARWIPPASGPVVLPVRHSAGH